MDSFKLADETNSDKPTSHLIKACVKCGIEKGELAFRTYGRGRRSTCIECENLKPEKSEEIPDVLTVKSSLGFSVGIINDDTYVISQKISGQETPMLVRLQPHEAAALVGWLNERLYPENVEE